MAKIQDFASLSIGLSVNPASQASFGVPLLLVDHADVPIDRRYRIVTRSSYATDLTASTAQANWCTALWGQNQNAESAYIGRWIDTASAAYMYFPDASTDYTVYVALAATAQLKIVEGAANEDINPDFTGDTSMADVAASIQVALAAGTIPAAYTCTVDALDRLVITSDNTGDAADAVSAATPAAGTDLLLTLGASVSEAGHDAETQGAAASAIFALDNTPFVVCERGGNIADQVALATSMNALDKITLLVVNDTDAKSAVATSDTGYQINALGYNKCFVMYTEHATANGAAANQHPDAAIAGEVFPQKEATVHLAMTPLTGLSKSGLDADGTTVKSITATESAALLAKGYDWLVKPSTVTHFTHGLAPGGNEIRIMFAKMFCEAKVSEDVYAYMISNNVVTFSDEDILAVGGIVEYWLAEMVDRKALDEGYEIVLPAASSFTAATKATHEMDLDDVTAADSQRAVNKIAISLSWSV